MYEQCYGAELFWSTPAIIIQIVKNSHKPQKLYSYIKAQIVSLLFRQQIRSSKSSIPALQHWGF